MTWTPTLYFTFPSQEAFEALIPAEWMGDEGPRLETHTRFVHVSGIQYRDDTPEGEPPVARAGYRVEPRFVGDSPQAWEVYRQNPKNPNVVIK